MCKGRRTAHAGRWPAREPELLRGHPGPLCTGAHRWASGSAAPRGWSRGAPWVERAAGAAPEGPRSRDRARRAAREGGRARGARGARGSMSQQRPARRLPSLLVDPAQETVRRRCRDPHQRGEPTGERGARTTGGSLLRGALVASVGPSGTRSLGAPGFSLQLPVLEPPLCFFAHFCCIYLLLWVSGRAGWCMDSTRRV